MTFHFVCNLHSTYSYLREQSLLGDVVGYQGFYSPDHVLDGLSQVKSWLHQWNNHIDWRRVMRYSISVLLSNVILVLTLARLGTPASDAEVQGLQASQLPLPTLPHLIL
jgi:hypothetical protein